ncbi:aminoglycoside 6-adenylyltransferase [Rubrobacter tropicus]|nr:aminoglycoside 6-adenylyltransferase [Rubrobacter tropicus]
MEESERHRGRVGPAGDLSRDPFLRQVLDWARRQDGLGAVILTGSRARARGPVDAASDYDVEVFVAEPERYGSSSAWLEEISPVWVHMRWSEGGGEDVDRRITYSVFFAGGLKADIQIRPMEVLADLAKGGLDALYERGYVVLADPSGLASRLPDPSGRGPRLRPPTDAELLAVCSEFWFEAAHIPPYLARGELWVVKVRDGTMKRMLLRLIEWDALARLGPEADVWHIGIHMREWAAPDVWDRLHRCYGRFDAGDAFVAFQATLSLFSKLSRRVAAGFGLDHPTRIEEAIRPHVAASPDL